MDWTLRRVETEEELEAVLALCARILGVDVLERAPYRREDWRERLEKTPELLFYAESGGIPVAAVLGRRESQESLIAGFVACEERFRRQGITRALMEKMEENGRALGCRYCTLGAAAQAEGFYRRCGYRVIKEIEGQKIFQKLL